MAGDEEFLRDLHMSTYDDKNTTSLCNKFAQPLYTPFRDPRPVSLLAHMTERTKESFQPRPSQCPST